MGCGCAGGKKATEDDPTILGDPVGPVVKVRATVSVIGAKAGETTWVKGTHVASMIAAGWLQEL